MKHFIALLVILLAAFCFAELQVTIDNPVGYHGVEKEFEATVIGDIKTECESEGGQGDGQALYWWKIEEEDIGNGTTDSSSIKSNTVELDFDAHNGKQVQIEICCKKSDQDDCEGDKVTATANIEVKQNLGVAIDEFGEKKDGENITFKATVSNIVDACGTDKVAKYTWTIAGEKQKEDEADQDGNVQSDEVELELEKHHGKKVQIEVRCKEETDEDPPKCEPPKCVTDEKDITVKGITIVKHPQHAENKGPGEKVNFNVEVTNTAECPKDNKLLFDWKLGDQSVQKKAGAKGAVKSTYEREIKEEDHEKEVSVTVCCLKDDDNCEESPKPKTSEKAKITIAKESSSTKNFIAIGAIIASLIMFL
jgi:predicted component of type VI protein secretion system